MRGNGTFNYVLGLLALVIFTITATSCIMNGNWFIASIAASLVIYCIVRMCYERTFLIQLTSIKEKVRLLAKLEARNEAIVGSAPEPAPDSEES